MQDLLLVYMYCYKLTVKLQLKQLATTQLKIFVQNWQIIDVKKFAAAVKYQLFMRESLLLP